jgi:hypothetical protein
MDFDNEYRRNAEVERMCDPAIPLTETLTVAVSAETLARLEAFRDKYGEGEASIDDAVRIVLAIGLAQSTDPPPPPPPLRIVR